METRYELGELKRKREMVHWTQKLLAKAARVSEATIERAERGLKLRYESYERIEKALSERCEILIQEGTLKRDTDFDDPTKSTSTARRMDHLIGNYALYALTTTAPESTILRANLVINGDMDHLKASVKSVDYHYNGDVVLDANSVTLLLSGVDHNEYMTIKFIYPMTAKFNVVNGTYAALTRANQPVCGIMIAHKCDEETVICDLPYSKCDLVIRNLLVYKLERPIIITRILKSNRLEDLDPDNPYSS